MKKLVTLIFVVALALLIDGTLSRDIFDYRIQTFAGWFGVFLILAIYAVIAWVESARKSEKKNNSK